MFAGWLRHRIVIQELVGAKNSYGEVVQSWQDVATVWASVEPLRGREYVEAAAAQANVDHRIRMRYRAGIGPAMRVKFGERVFAIVSVIDARERHKELELMCKEGVDD